METKRERVNMIFAITNQGHTRFMVYEEKMNQRLFIDFLPPYAPESSPDEYLNHALKLDVHSGDLPRIAKDVKHKIHSFMRKLQHNVSRVRAFFRHPCVSHCLIPE